VEGNVGITDGNNRKKISEIIKCGNCTKKSKF
jgi:hypothetical protein